MDEAKIREFCKVFRDEHSLAEYARSDGHRDWWSGGTWLHRGDVILELGADDLLQFARELLAAEREECARVCEVEALAAQICVGQLHGAEMSRDTAKACAAAIRRKP